MRDAISAVEDPFSHNQLPLTDYEDLGQLGQAEPAS